MIVPSKRQRALDSSRTRPFNIGVSRSEHAAVSALALQRGCSVSELIREAIERSSAIVEDGPSPYDTAYLSARLSPDLIEQLSAAASAAGMEPVTWLRIVVLAYCRVGTGDVIARQVECVRKTKP